MATTPDFLRQLSWTILDYLRQQSLSILDNYKNNYDTGTTTTNKSVGFDPSAIQSCFYFKNGDVSRKLKLNILRNSEVIVISSLTNKILKQIVEEFLICEYVYESSGL